MDFFLENPLPLFISETTARIMMLFRVEGIKNILQEEFFELVKTIRKNITNNYYQIIIEMNCSPFCYHSLITLCIKS